MAGFKLNFTYLEDRQWQLGTHCNFSTHHPSSLGLKKKHISLPAHSLLKKVRCQEES